jgi:starvation-inducible outer membrane lipoprotein
VISLRSAAGANAAPRQATKVSFREDWQLAYDARMQRLLIFAGLSLAGCASGSNNATQTTTGTPHMASASEAPASGESDVSCSQEVRTGTHLDKKVCRSQAEKDQDKRAVEELYLNPSARPGAR